MMNEVIKTILYVTLINTGLYRNIKNITLIAVDKNKYIAQLKILPHPTQKPFDIASFQIAVGKKKGDKFKKNDDKTPSGIYLPVKHISRSNLNNLKYGPFAITLNFPNIMDKNQGKSGYGIWLHGAGNDKRIKKKNITRGCVAFLNNDILDIRKWIIPGSSIVIISDDISKINNHKDIESIYKNVLSWQKNWQNKKIEKYIDMYSNDFKQKTVGGQRNIDEFVDYKKKIFHMYMKKKLKIKLNNLRIATHPKYSISIMNQSFIVNNKKKSYGMKILYWIKKNGNWKIIYEDFFKNKLFKKIEFKAEDIVLLQSKSRIENIKNTLHLQNKL